ncbi:MAG TPA: HEAT repeat domain-containing protein [Gammaproteobacteria bacterium]|nr:HEAT repeat domain-containing protein [Gammaproteobacteria bacterium]
MWAYLSPPGSDPLVDAAAGTTLVAAAVNLVLLAYTLLLRRATIVAARRRRSVFDRWRRIFAAAMLSDDEARGAALPRFSRRETGDLLEQWNAARESVEGDSVARLVVLGERLGFGKIARRRLARRKLGARLLAIQTLGNLRDPSAWDAIAAFLSHPNTALSVTAAAALVDIDAARAVPLVMPCVRARVDWPDVSVFRLLKKAGEPLVTQPLCNAILTSEAAAAVRLLKYASLARSETIDQLIELLLRERDEPAVLAAALKAISDYAGLPRIETLATHEAWYVRAQAARLLGRVGQARDVRLLEKLLADREWWVRYRAAQAIVSLPWLGPNRLRELADAQSDAFARDIMRHAMAEVGLA